MNSSHFPNLKSLPPILDFEASSLSDTSYPISAGLIISGHVHYWIIKPEPNWIDWSLQSQAIHGLKRSYIEAHGMPAQQVYLDMMTILTGHRVIYSDAPSWEEFWLQRLGEFNLRIHDISELIVSDMRDNFSSELNKTFFSNNLTQHRADHDALAIALTVQKLRNNKPTKMT